MIIVKSSSFTLISNELISDSANDEKNDEGLVSSSDQACVTSSDSSVNVVCCDGDEMDKLLSEI